MSLDLLLIGELARLFRSHYVVLLSERLSFFLIFRSGLVCCDACVAVIVVHAGAGAQSSAFVLLPRGYPRHSENKLVYSVVLLWRDSKVCDHVLHSSLPSLQR